jgi:CDP-4-dehydro-6-deoxyglucose reductase, E3
MPELLTLSRAARLADVSRAELQRRIRQGDIETFEGQVAIGDLLRAYPTVRLDRDKGFERVESIKAAAVPRDQQADAVLPSPHVLLSRLRALAEVLVQKVSALDAAEELLDALRLRLAAIADTPAPEPRTVLAAVGEVLSWLAAERQALADHPQPDNRAQLFAKDTFLRIMAASIKIIPSGHEFFVEGTETILDASVRAGLKLAYGCSSGNCGTCKARVVSGEVWKTADHDYVLSEREKQMGYILTCSNTAVTDLVLEAPEALRVEDLPLQDIRAGVRKVERLGDDLLLLQVQTPRTQTLRFMAGQRARLTLENGASGEVPIASCPCNGRNLQFYLRRRHGDALAESAFTDLAAHQMITVTGPTGTFVLHEGSPEPAVFVALSDGIAPIKSILEHAVSIDLIEAFHLYWASSASQGHDLAKWCRAMAESLDNFRYTQFTETPPGESGAARVLDALAADYPDPRGMRFYLAGPARELELLIEGLAALGVDREVIAREVVD